jgi:hypothetical protein
MANFRQITPFMYVPDIVAGEAFLTKLGFRTLSTYGDYRYMEREGCGIRLMQNSGDDGAPPGNRRFAYYVDVRDVDALYREWQPFLATFPLGDVHGPGNKPYGQRELCILAPDGNVLTFGQPVNVASRPT